MTTGGSDRPPPRSGDKPADDELVAELDAWDRTFDALHIEEGIFSMSPAFDDSGDDDVTRTGGRRATRIELVGTECAASEWAALAYARGANARGSHGHCRRARR
jgi:hypothetical protein